MDLSKRYQLEDTNCIVKQKGDNKNAMNDTTNSYCKYDYTKVKESANGRIRNSLYHCMYSISKRSQATKSTFLL